VSEQPDKEGKTEQPSEKRLTDAIEKGNVPFSNEPGNLTSLLAISVIGLLIVAQATSAMSQRLGILLQNAAAYSLSDGKDAFQIIAEEVWVAFTIAAPVLALICLGGIIGPLGQNVPQANLERLRPKAERLSPRANFKRLFGTQALVNFGKTLIKVAAVSTLAYWVLSRRFRDIVEASASDIAAIPGLMLSIFNAIVAPLCFAALVIAILDLIFTRFNWLSELRMTRQELKDEHKQSEGDPAVKAKIQQAARQRTRSRMMADLPRATLLVANPTHFAVALRYVPTEGGAPVVLAKGVDHLALRIRKQCETIGIPVVENKPLARSLHGATDLGEQIPAEFYRAVAEVIHFVNMRDKAARRHDSQV
jgi:flagellar biosynthesis protein FlhB